VLLSSAFSYGDWLDLPPGGPVRRRRAGVLMKSVIPRRFIPDSIGVYADADEFLVLPPEITGLSELVRRMREEESDAVHASLIEMYPETYSDLAVPVEAPEGFDDLLRIAPCFDAHHLVELSGQRPIIVGESASSRLFREYAIGERRRLFHRLPLPVRRRLTRSTFGSAVYKTPVVHFRDGVELDGSYDVSGARHSSILLGLLHFKFTPESLAKTERIIAEKSHSRGSHKYVGYRELYREMQRSQGPFTYRGTERYGGPASLLRAGLIRGQ
jgi:hypothetical protein